MSSLREQSIQKCVEVLADFQDSVSVDETNDTLKEKKMQAEMALTHLSTIFDVRSGSGYEGCKVQAN